jgi:phosphoglycerol transferase MdoB-like AlkP superfamily enzyme
VETERAVLTGFPGWGPSRPHQFLRLVPQEPGYETEGSHPCYEWFYNRLNINENLGFDQLLLFGKPLRRDYLDDDFFPDLMTLYEQYRSDSDAPLFSFNVTYQGHGPYNDE